MNEKNTKIDLNSKAYIDQKNEKPFDLNTLLDAVLPVSTVGLGTITKINTDGTTVVQLLGCPHFFEALSSHGFLDHDIGKTVGCSRIHNSHKLMIIGLLAPQQQNNLLLDQILDEYTPNKDDFSLENDSNVFDTPIDEQFLQYMEQQSPDIVKPDITLEAANSLTLKCGESSIRLSADGHIDIRGKHLNNRASKMNRISGGSVKIN